MSTTETDARAPGAATFPLRLIATSGPMIRAVTGYAIVDATGREVAAFGIDEHEAAAAFVYNINAIDAVIEYARIPFVAALTHELFKGGFNLSQAEYWAVPESPFSVAFLAIREQEKRDPNAPSLFLGEE